MAERLTLLQIIAEDYVAHRRDWTLPGFRAIAVYRFGAWSDTLPSPVWGRAMRLLARILYRHIRNRYGIELPATTKIGRRVIVEHQGRIVIHGRSEIGDDCIIRQGVTFGNRRLSSPLEAPRLGRRVNVGAGAVLLGSVSIGDDVNIGANAVVLSDIPPRCTVVGPAAEIKPHRVLPNADTVV